MEPDVQPELGAGEEQGLRRIHGCNIIRKFAEIA